MTSTEVVESDLSADLLRAIEVDLLFAEAKQRARIRRSRLVLIVTFAVVGLIIATAAVVRPADQLPVTCPLVCSETQQLSAVRTITIGYYSLTLTGATGSTITNLSYREKASTVKKALAIVFHSAGADQSESVTGWGWHGFEIIDDHSWVSPYGVDYFVAATARSVDGVAIRSSRDDRVGDIYPIETAAQTGFRPANKTVYRVTPTCPYGNRTVDFQYSVGLIPGYHELIIGSDSSKFPPGPRAPRLASIEAPNGTWPYCE